MRREVGKEKEEKSDRKKRESWFPNPHDCRVRSPVRKKMVTWGYPCVSLWPTLCCRLEATKPSTIFTTTQTDPKITNIICPPEQCLAPVSSTNKMPSTSSSMPAVSTSSSSTQAHLLPSTSSVIPTHTK
ncbi:hypothetical protein TNCV_2060451 [Trichonephila clavipes]|nr:hypothetical protein TNCV_2060451 [Trichonephila clavipes]